MKQEDPADSLVGRTTALLNLSVDEFDVLPCHFSNDAMQFLKDYGWENVFPGYEYYPHGFQRAVPFLYASLTYHFLKEDLHTLLHEEPFK